MTHSLQPSPIFVLHTQPFRNTSLLAELFSLQHGRIKVVARSARGPKARFRSYLQPFNPLLASWLGRNELKTLTHLELQSAPFRLHATALWCGFYLNELLFRLLPREDPHPEIFESYQNTLLHLSEAKMNEWYLRLFEKKLLESLGYGLSLQHDVETGEVIQSHLFYKFILQRGFVFSADDENSPWIFSGKSLLNFSEERTNESSVLSEIKRLMRIVLTHHLGQPIKSREWV